MTTDLSLPSGGRQLRCALFVDFDNVYLGLRRLDAAAADAFSTDPGHWLAELATGSDATGEFTRRFLIRACYLNPSAFSQFRPNFTRAGFQVVDCPSLTQQGKSSADINLVLDAVDALAATTRYDEIMLVSADADFTPLALRARAADRLVTIITASPAASAYRSVADTVINADGFVELVTKTALDDVAAGEAPIAPAATPAPAPAVTGRVPASSGRRASSDAPATAAAPAPKTAAAAPATAPEGPPSAARRAVLQRVRSAERPIPLGTAAQVAQQADPALPGSKWAGAGSFLAWLARELPALASATTPAPGFIWDPARFDDADLPSSAPQTDPSALHRQVVAVTDVPGLTAADYAKLLTVLAADLKTSPFVRTETARRVREACQAKGAKIGRASVNTVLSGILFTGLDLTTPPSLKELAKAWADNVVGLARGARVELSAADEAAVRSWVSGGLLKG